MTEVFNISSHSYYGIIDLEAFARQQKLSSKRETETRAKEHLMQVMMAGAEIVYNDKGKPFLKHSPAHMSVSHSHDKLAIMVNHLEPTGIDIELIRGNVVNIRGKFLDTAELADAGDDIEKLLVYWAAKETLYKIYGLKEVHFIGHLFVEPFIYNGKGSLRGHIRLDDFKKTFELRYERSGAYILVYALYEIKEAC